ncbi:laccase [Pisolithus orientalis]|uniref:laccase n=1 Tax=Pisolithus orientalis TaxID=936130 RepID=UPI002224B3B1|nr:laccase [Pisolithus orientalis]KAI6008784.1 laccase [Pisolithus orientalis]
MFIMHILVHLLAFGLINFYLATATVIGPQLHRAPSKNALGPVSTIEILNRVISPDGFSRSAVLAGGTFPGPLIQAQKGDEFLINVTDLLNDTSMDITTSIHWHGILQHQSNWADGTAWITQCPIQPTGSFLHRFTVPDQAGTYWYHSHLSAQYCDGLRGPLVIYDPDDPLADMYDVDDESTIIVLSDWYHKPSPLLYNPPFTPDSTLINGLGRYPGGPSSPLAVLNVTQGQRYRFRIIGASCDAWFNFTIDGHSMTIIEADSNEVEPVVVDSLAVHAGQRYSVVVTADQPVDNYWIRSVSNFPNQTFDGGLNSAILRYGGAPIQDPTTDPGPYVLPFDESTLHPLHGSGVPGTPGGALNPSQLLPNGSVYELPANKTIEISIPATDLTPGGALGGPHPIHLHGHAFDVVRVAGKNTYNYINPVRRDTVSLGSQTQNDNVTIRFTTNNPGPWFFHCHIDWHLHNGFAVVMAEAPLSAGVQESKATPEYWYKLCSSQSIVA